MPQNVRPRVDTVELRQAERKASTLMAFAIPREGRGLPCCIRNVSETGAMLEFLGTGPVELPRRFELVLVNNARRSVKMMWRAGRRIGVLFCP